MPCPVCPCPTAATPLCLPRSSITAPVPSLPSHPRFCVCFFFPCPSSSCCFSPSLLLLLSRLCPIPAPLCSHDSQIHRQLHGVAASPAQGALSPLGHCCSSNAPSLTQKAALEAAASSAVVGRIQGCAAPLGAAGACILCLQPLAWLCLHQQLPEELTHFWLQQGRGCPVPLVLLSLCFSLIFDV